MKIITYNIFYGGEERIPLIAQILREQNPDVVALQEANDRANAEKLAAALNMQLIFGDSNNTFHMAWLSRLPISCAHNYQLPIFHQCQLKAYLPLRDVRHRS